MALATNLVCLPSPRRTCLFKSKELDYSFCVRTKTNTGSMVSFCLMDGSISRLSSYTNPPSDMIRTFYRCINEKNLKELGNHISEDCLIEDSLFIKPFRGKTEAMHFFEELTQSMGKDVKFRIRNVYEDGSSGAAASWHLAWKEIEIPFTKGCTFIDIKKGERIIIKKAQTIIEPQVKAGHLILTLLKFVTVFIGKFPSIPEWFLKASQLFRIRWLSRIICFILFKRFLDKFLKNYLHFPHSIAELSSYTFKILQHIYRSFFK